MRQNVIVITGVVSALAAVAGVGIAWANHCHEAPQSSFCTVGSGGSGGDEGTGGSGPPAPPPPPPPATSRWVVQVATNTTPENAIGSLVILRRDLGVEGTIYQLDDDAFITVLAGFPSKAAASERAKAIRASGDWKYGAGPKNLGARCPSPRAGMLRDGAQTAPFYDCR